MAERYLLEEYILDGWEEPEPTIWDHNQEAFGDMIPTKAELDADNDYYAHLYAREYAPDLYAMARGQLPTWEDSDPWHTKALHTMFRVPIAIASFPGDPFEDDPFAG